jgi:predicted SAM-dependent methyltransferase
VIAITFEGGVMKKVILGAGNSNYEGWIQTQEKDLNLLDKRDFYKCFQAEESVDAFLAEHVFEHPAYTHKVFYDYKTLETVFKSAGFEIDLLEYCDEKGRFHFNYWNPEQGMIGRSLRFDTRNNNGKLGMVSIIIDAIK